MKYRDQINIDRDYQEGGKNNGPQISMVSKKRENANENNDQSRGEQEKDVLMDQHAQNRKKTGKRPRPSW